MVPALKLDRRIGPAAYLRPSLGVAGGNLERDLITLKDVSCMHRIDVPYLDSLITANQRRFEWVERQLERHLFSQVPHPRLAIWGLTYKKDTRSTKNSPALRLIEGIGGRASIQVWDPVLGPGDLRCRAEIAPSRDDALTGADALTIMADWDVFGAADLDAVRARMRNPVIVDCVGVLAHRRAEMSGIEYVGMGSTGGVDLAKYLPM
jgi:UDPglucose 6-dehydrogenase